MKKTTRPPLTRHQKRLLKIIEKGGWISQRIKGNKMTIRLFSADNHFLQTIRHKTLVNIMYSLKYKSEGVASDGSFYVVWIHRASAFTQT